MEAISQSERRSVFHCKSPGDASLVKKALGLLLIGALIGGLGWFEADRTLSAVHIIGWLAVNAIIFASLAGLEIRKPILSIGVDDAGLTITRDGATRLFGWTEIEAARFQAYPMIAGERPVAFLLRASGRNFELTPEFADDATRDSFEETILGELAAHEIPEISPGLPGFQRTLSVAGAWVFVGSIFAMLAAHALGFHTMGTIFGLAFMLTGSVVAWMTRGERLSRLIVAATLLLVVFGSGILWSCHVNVRQVLQAWERMEKNNLHSK